MAGTWSVIFGITLGVIASRFPNGKIDGLVTTTGILGLATPHFWLATLLVLVFAVYLGILPSVGYVSLFEDPIESTPLPCAARDRLGHDHGGRGEADGAFGHARRARP